MQAQSAYCEIAITRAREMPARIYGLSKPRFAARTLSRGRLPTVLATDETAFVTDLTALESQDTATAACGAPSSSGPRLWRRRFPS